MVFVQSTPTATLLSDGTVLVAGGGASPAIRKAEIYDPATNTWTPTGSMNKQRAFHAAVLLESGEVLVAGAFAPPDKTSELYDPTTGTWTLTANLPIAIEQATLTLLSDGRAIVAGGVNPHVNHGSTIYDPATSTWGAVEHVPGDHGVGTTATRLLDGRILLVGGNDESFMPTASVDLYQPGD